MLKGFIWSILILASVIAVAWLWQILRFIIKRVILRFQIGRMGYRVRPLRPLWWLVDLRNHCDLLLETRDPIPKILAVKLIPTIMPGSEYSIGEKGKWDHKLNFLVPMGMGVHMMNFGYRRCLPRRVNFHKYPHAVPVYLSHPHPFAITRGHRGERKWNINARAVSVPLWVDDTLMLDVQALRDLSSMMPEGREKMLGRS